jgi:hypothetical protein
MDVQTKPPRGAVNPPVIDSRFGRRWMRRGEMKQPVLYSRIGEQLRNTKLHRTICRWVIGTPNWKKLITEQYRKRWPLHRGLRASLFAEFALKPFSTRSFYETCQTLPFNGVGGKFWQGKEGRPHDGTFFELKTIQYQIRPWKAEARGDMIMNSIPIRNDVSPLGKSVGKWNFEPPAGSSKLFYRPSFPVRLNPPS